MINKNNTCLVTTTIQNNEVSLRRKQNIKNEMDKYEIPIFFIHGVIETDKTYFNVFKKRILAFKQTKCKYGLLCDDDFHPCENFLEELNKTVSLLPSGWRSLHLCPGFLWGRKFRRCTEPGTLDPEEDISDLPYHESRRFFVNCGSGLFFKKQIWLGGPNALLVSSDTINDLLNDAINCYLKYKLANDVGLTKILNNKDFVCMSPMLGYENEQGGVTLSIS
jgi:hypothetical protein